MKTRRRKKPVAVPEEPFTIVDIEDFETVCHVCDAEFLDGEDLKLHIAQVHLNESNGKMICKVCFIVLPGAEAFVSHFIFKHLENSLFCFYCYRAFATPLLLDQHELKHRVLADNSSITCSQCVSNFTNRNALQKHEYEQHGNTEDSVILNGFFSLLSSVLNIKIKYFLDCICKKKRFICRNCKYSSSKLKDFIQHLKTLNCRSFTCDKCFNVYKKKSSIMTHMRKKPQCHNFCIEREILEACPKCEQYFNSIEIGDHRSSCSAVKCSSCGKILNSISDLAEHQIEKHHTSIKLETCKFCKKDFVGMLNLKKHLSRAHKNRNQYKYNCVYCSSMFTHPKKLFGHLYTQHKTIEPYTCKICNKCFRLRKHFTVHIKLLHKSIGFVEFDDNFHVIFTETKSDNSSKPESNVNMDSTTDASDNEPNDLPQEKGCTGEAEVPESKIDDSAKLEDNTDPSQIVICPDNNIVSNDTNISEVHDVPRHFNIFDIEHKAPSLKKRKRQHRIVRLQPKKMEDIKSIEQFTDDSEEEPLSKVQRSLVKEKDPISTSLKRRMAIRDKKAKLTCKICNKYCYTVQNYHDHLTLHEKSKMKRCIKCHKYFKSRKELKNHIDTTHSSSKLIETLKFVMEKRKKNQPAQKTGVRPGETIKSLIENRKKQQAMKTENAANKFRKTIKKVEIIDDCTATITPMSEHGLSVKNFIENFKPEADNVNISNSVTIRAITVPVDKEPTIRMKKLNPEPVSEYHKLKFPVKFKDPPSMYTDSKVSVKLVQQLITKPKVVNMSYNERIPLIEDNKEAEKYCNMFADETDYTQYNADVIPEVAQEVMLGDLEDIPRTRRLAQEIIIPKISDEHGGVRIGHLLPKAPFYKIVKVKKLLKAANEPAIESVQQPDQDVKLPDGTRLVSVKNPYSHLIPNEHLEEVLKANRNKNYTPKTKNIEKAIAKALNEVKSPRERKSRRKVK